MKTGEAFSRFCPRVPLGCPEEARTRGSSCLPACVHMNFQKIILMWYDTVLVLPVVRTRPASAVGAHKSFCFFFLFFFSL